MVEKHYAGRLDGFDKEIAESLEDRRAACLRHDDASRTAS
jgi:hypothetical protein